MNYPILSVKDFDNFIDNQSYKRKRERKDNIESPVKKKILNQDKENGVTNISNVKSLKVKKQKHQINNEEKMVSKYINSKKSCSKFPSSLLEEIKGNFYDHLFMSYLECSQQQNFYKDTIGVSKKYSEIEKSLEKNNISSFKTFSEEDIILRVSKEDRKKYLYHEIFTGLYGTNGLRKDIPNFAYILGGFKCSEPVEGVEGKIETWCSNRNSRTVYSLQEKIVDYSGQESINLKVALANISAKSFSKIYLQILLSLNYAYEKLKFTHYDLDVSNIILRNLGQDYQIRYPYGKSKIFLITDQVATITDYLFSFLRVEGQNYGFPGNTDFLNLSLSSTKPFILNDAFKLLLTSAEKIVSSIPLPLGSDYEPYFQIFKERFKLILVINKLYNYFFPSNLFQFSTLEYLNKEDIFKYYRNDYPDFVKIIRKHQKNLYFLPRFSSSNKNIGNIDLKGFINYFLTEINTEDFLYREEDESVKKLYCHLNCQTNCCLNLTDFKIKKDISVNDLYDYVKIEEELLKEEKEFVLSFGDFRDRLIPNTLNKIDEYLSLGNESVFIIEEINSERKKSDLSLLNVLYKKIKSGLDYLFQVKTWVEVALLSSTKIPIKVKNDIFPFSELERRKEELRYLYNILKNYEKNIKEELFAGLKTQRRNIYREILKN